MKISKTGNRILVFGFIVFTEREYSVKIYFSV